MFGTPYHNPNYSHIPRKKLLQTLNINLGGDALQPLKTIVESDKHPIVYNAMGGKKQSSSQRYTYNKKSYVIREGKKGGRFILVAGKKKYIKSM
jgi:hypothetical protein